MTSVANSRGFRKLGRTILQWALAVGSTGITAVVAERIGLNFGPLAAAGFQAFWLFFYTFAQNSLETAGKIPVLFPTPGLVSNVLTPVAGAVTDITPSVAPVAVATVDAVANVSGQVVGDVTDLVGGVVGTVEGQLPKPTVKKVKKKT